MSTAIYLTARSLAVTQVNASAAARSDSGVTCSTPGSIPSRADCTWSRTATAACFWQRGEHLPSHTPRFTAHTCCSRRQLAVQIPSGMRPYTCPFPDDHQPHQRTLGRACHKGCYSAEAPTCPPVTSARTQNSTVVSLLTFWPIANKRWYSSAIANCKNNSEQQHEHLAGHQADGIAIKLCKVCVIMADGWSYEAEGTLTDDK